LSGFLFGKVSLVLCEGFVPTDLGKGIGDYRAVFGL
jgi:hypothetical protein